MSGREVKYENQKDISPTDIKLVHALLNNKKQVRWLVEDGKIYIEIDLKDLKKNITQKEVKRT